MTFCLSIISVPMLPDLLLAFSNSQSSVSLIIIGLLALAGGVIMMMQHKQVIDEVMNSDEDPRIQLFERRKFRRRSLASAMIAAIGILMIALPWAREPGAFFGLVTILMLLLLAVLFLAFLDLMSVSLQTVTNKASAREEMLDEYLRRRKELEQNEESEPSDA